MYKCIYIKMSIILISYYTNIILIPCIDKKYYYGFKIPTICFIVSCIV